MKKGFIIRLLLLMVLIALMAVTIVARVGVSENNTNNTTATVLSGNELETYEKIQSLIDEGDCLGVAECLLNGDVSSTLFSYMSQTDGEILDFVIADAMVVFREQRELAKLVALRTNGYVSDACFIIYWESMGYGEAEGPSFAEESPGVDKYLVYELCLACQQDVLAVNSLRQIRQQEMINDSVHETLVNALGFDYMEEQGAVDGEPAPYAKLTEAEISVYESALECIDQGDGYTVVQKMLVGEINEAVYEALMQEDASAIEYILATEMASFVEEGTPEKVVLLRANGYVSDECFDYYWETVGNERPDDENYREDLPGVDLYLMHELEQIYVRHENGEDILRSLWSSGLISDPLQEELINRLGFDYTMSQ